MTDAHAQEAVLPAQIYVGARIVRTLNDEESNDNSDDQSERDSDSDFSDLEL